MDLYMKFVNTLSNQLPEFNNITNIVSIYLGGSVSRGDYVVGASDIDLYVIYNNEYESFVSDFTKQIYDIAKQYLADLLSWCPDGVSISYTSYTDVINGNSWLGIGAEYYSFIESSKLLYGKNIFHDIRKPEEKKIKEIASQSLAQLKTIVNQYIPTEKFDRYFVRGIFGLVFSAIHFSLNLKSIYIRKKELMIYEINRYDNVIGAKLNEIYSLWISFGKNDLSNKETLHLLKLVKEVVIAL